VILGEVVFPYPSLSFYRREVFACHKLIPELVAQKLLPDKVTPTEQPLYFSRTKLNKNTANRQILGEEQLENILRERNFAIVYPEQLTLQEQIYLVNKHKYIVGPWGSSLHTIIFSLSDYKNIFCLSNKDDIFISLPQFDALKSVNSTYIAAIQSQGGQNIVYGQQILDVDAALSGLKEFNLL
jgi:capsular polysaccharide biosynthesis protein